MAVDAHKNFAYSTILTAPSPAASGTSLVVQSSDGAKFPATSFNATVWPAGSEPTTVNAEIVRVTNIATDTFTISRTQESTNARTMTVGDQIAATITAKTLEDVEDDFLVQHNTDGTHDAITVTIANTENKVAGIFTQNDTTNNPDTVVIINTGTGDAIAITTAGVIFDITASASSTFNTNLINILVTGTYDDNVLNINTTHASNNAILLTLDQDSTTANNPVARILNESVGDSLFLDQNGNGIALNIDTEVANDGTIVQITPAGASPSAFLVARNDDVTGNIVLRVGGSYIWVDSTGDLRIHTSNPDADNAGTIVGTQS